MRRVVTCVGVIFVAEFTTFAMRSYRCDCSGCIGVILTGKYLRNKLIKYHIISIIIIESSRVVWFKITVGVVETFHDIIPVIYHLNESFWICIVTTWIDYWLAQYERDNWRDIHFRTQSFIIYVESQITIDIFLLQRTIKVEHIV